jgi:predicted 3-demethylubiquinone-9 3-methyltransferase (glyoxalase superfamily)
MITPNLWFPGNAEEAVNFYTSIFKDSKIGNISRHTKEAAAAAGMPEGSVLVIEFELNGQKFSAINGGPYFRFTEAVSFVINCETQQEVDEFWKKLSEGGEPGRCGWLKDKYGLSWQVVPTVLAKLMTSTEPGKTGRVMQALLKMNKLNIDALEEA